MVASDVQYSLARCAGDCAGISGRARDPRVQQLVAPIALYPDELIAQILAASPIRRRSYRPTAGFISNSNLQVKQLAADVDQQSWDPSVKALTAFPSVLTNLDTNLSWTSALGDAYFNQQQDVLDAVQVMRGRAQNAGNLQSTPQETVTTQGPTIIIEPVNADLLLLAHFTIPGWSTVPQSPSIRDTFTTLVWTTFH